MSTSRSESRQDWGDKVLTGLPAGPGEAALVADFLLAHDFSAGTRRAFAGDLRKLAAWFTAANNEPYRAARVTVRDVADFRDDLRRRQGRAVATVNRALVAVRRYLGWLADHGHIPSNPAVGVKELRRQPVAPKGLDRVAVRRLLREVELRADVRAGAVFSVLLYTGARVSDLAGLEMHDVVLSERAGSLVFRLGKGGKQRTVPLPLPARRALEAYLASRPPVETTRVFVGERGPLTTRGFRALCDRYSAVTGVRLHPHAFRHTMAKKFLEDTGNDLVSLAQILGHESLTTTARYSTRSQDQLADAADRIAY